VACIVELALPISKENVRAVGKMKKQPGAKTANAALKTTI